MGRIWIFILLASFALPAEAQHFFPVKVDNEWGLIDAQGEVVLKPVYDAIGNFEKHGYAVMQREGGVGLLNRHGREIVPPRYDDLKVLDSLFIAVMDQGEWMVINLDGEIVLRKGYERVKVWDGRFLAFRVDDQWGVVSKRGRTIAEARYDELSLEPGPFFLTRKGDRLGLLDGDGRIILENLASEINIYHDSLFFYKRNARWGAVDRQGNRLIREAYDAYSRLSAHFVKLIRQGETFLFSEPCRRVINREGYEDFYAFSAGQVIVKENRRLGLMDWCGELVLAPRYSEIQPYGAEMFRVNYEGRWGVVRPGDRPLIPFQYDYIAPLRQSVCIVKKNRKLGLVNFRGEEVVQPEYDRIQLERNRAKAYQQQKGDGESLTLFTFNEEGQLKGNSRFDRHFQVKIEADPSGMNQTPAYRQSVYVLENFEWFYSPREDRWGLRRLADGRIQIDPIFQYVQTDKSLGISIVGIGKENQYEYERTSFRFDVAYGIVKNDLGLLVTELDFLDIRLEDFKRGLPVARCVLGNGKHGLIDRNGQIVRQDLAYIGDFVEGVARMSIQGRLSGSMDADYGLGPLHQYLNGLSARGVMVDFTKYDQLFRQQAQMICEDCRWGYLDTSGRVVVPPRYSFARRVVNGVGIVEKDGKWGLVDRNGNERIPCRYDNMHFLENTGNQFVQVYIREPKYGLIDTLGRLTVNTIYDEIGAYREKRLAVKRNGMWGFVDRNGLEVIPCRFREVRDFSDGLAAVKMGNHWGFIDRQGRLVIDFKYLRAGNFRCGLAWAYRSEGVGFINPQGEWVIPARFDRAFDFYKGVARVVQDGEFGLIDTRGKFLERPAYTDIQPFNAHDLALVRYGGDRVRYGVINLQGGLITNRGYREIEPYSEGLAAVKDRNGYGFIDTTGRLVIPDIYSKVSPFSEGRAAVQLDGACGYIDRSGQQIVDHRFTKCLDYHDGKAVVYQGMRKAGLVNAQGRTVLKPSVNRLLTFNEGRGLVRDEQYRFYFITEQAGRYDGYYQQATRFQHGVAVVQARGKWGVINQKGIQVVPPKYDRIENFEDGFAKVRIQGFIGLSNLEGEFVLDPNYESVSYAGSGLFRVEQGDKVGYFDMEGTWVWELSD